MPLPLPIGENIRHCFFSKGYEYLPFSSENRNPAATMSPTKRYNSWWMELAWLKEDKQLALKREYEAIEKA